MPKISVENHSFVYAAFYFCIGRCKFHLPTRCIINEADRLCNNTVYTNCLLATLNARKKIQHMGSVPSDPLSMMEFAKFRSTREQVRWKIPSLRINAALSNNQTNYLLPSD